MGWARHPNNLRAAISEEVLRGLYVTRGLGLEAAAVHLGVSPTTVRRRLRELGITARPRGPVPAFVGDPRFVLGSPFTWSADIAYIVGLIATDGCLSKNGRTICIVSKDGDILRSVRTSLGGGAIGLSNNGRDQWCYRYQFSNR